MQGEKFSQNKKKRADQNKTVQGGFFSSKLINVHARLFGTLEYTRAGYDGVWYLTLYSS